MFTRIAVFALSLVMATAIDIPGDSQNGRTLVQNARRVQQNQNGQYNGQYNNDMNWNEIDTSYLAGYSAKFQGCHHVQKWNDAAEDADDVKIMTQRLVRFRMCPADTCTSANTKGCDSNYGDYLVDMETYLEAYMGQMQAQYMNYNNRELEEGNNFADLLTCSEIEMNDGQRKLANQYYNGYYNNNANADIKYYVGPYCAQQGGEIRIGVFTDDTCTVAASGGEDIYKMVKGMALPYSESSIVNIGCVSCGGNGQVTEMCDTLYGVSGKCETKMNVYYPNESSCGYIEGIKVIRDDGVIRTTSARKSPAAAVTTGLFLTASLLLSGYVYYLRTKLGRARVNLAASSQM